jgi:hypothetical protein
MASRRVAKQEPSAVPALYQPAALDLGGSDVAMPRVYIGQGLSNAVSDGTAKMGDVYLANGKDDPEPEIQWSERSRDAGLLFSILGLKRGKSLNVEGELETWDYNDPEAPEDARTTYDYTVALPEASDMPARLLLKSTSTGTARQINLILAKAQRDGIPPYSIGFRLTSKRRKNDKGTFFVAQATREDLRDDAVEFAAGLAELVASAPTPQPTASTAPAI